MEKVKKQYGLWTGIAMVVGIVIGSGVFLKAPLHFLQVDKCPSFVCLLLENSSRGNSLPHFLQIFVSIILIFYN